MGGACGHIKAFKLASLVLSLFLTSIVVEGLLG